MSGVDIGAFRLNQIKQREYSPTKLKHSPYKYFHEWKYDDELFYDLSWVDYGISINVRREAILDDNARTLANKSLEIVIWIFGIYMTLYILNSFRKWLYKK